MEVFLIVLGGMVVSFLAVRVWVFIVDTFFGGLKKLNPFRKKNTMTWHTLNETTERKKEEILKKESHIDCNTREL